MPLRDKTGPRGIGPKTGRGLGGCLVEKEGTLDKIKLKNKKTGNKQVDKILGL